MFQTQVQVMCLLPRWALAQISSDMRCSGWEARVCFSLSNFSIYTVVDRLRVLAYTRPQSQGGHLRAQPDPSQGGAPLWALQVNVRNIFPKE